MLFGSPLRAAISRSGSASPDDRNADSSARRMDDRLHEIRIAHGWFVAHTPLASSSCAPSGAPASAPILLLRQGPRQCFVSLSKTLSRCSDARTRTDRRDTRLYWAVSGDFLTFSRRTRHLRRVSGCQTPDVARKAFDSGPGGSYKSAGSVIKELFMYSKLVSIVVIWLFLVSAAVSAQQSASSGLVGQVTDSSQAPSQARRSP